MSRLIKAQQRHAQHYLETLEHLHERYLQGNNVIADALSQLDQDWNQIQQAQAWAETGTPENEVATELCQQFPLVATRLIELRLSPYERIRWMESALAIAQQEQDCVDVPRKNSLLST